MTVIPFWRVRLARDDSAAATCEAVEYYHAVEAGQVSEPDIVFYGERRIRSGRRFALPTWLEAGHVPLRRIA